MTPATLLAEALLGAVLGMAVGAPIISMQGPTSDFSFVRDLAGAGGVGAVILVVWLNQKDRKEERDKATEERKLHAELLAKEREQSASERQHGLDRVQEITSTFSKTVLDIVARKP